MQNLRLETLPALNLIKSNILTSRNCASSPQNLGCRN